MMITGSGTEQSPYDESPLANFGSVDRWSDTFGLTPMGDFTFTGGDANR
jgi:hypothetical protein